MVHRLTVTQTSEKCGPFSQLMSRKFWDYKYCR